MSRSEYILDFCTSMLLKWRQRYPSFDGNRITVAKTHFRNISSTDQPGCLPFTILCVTRGVYSLRDNVC